MRSEEKELLSSHSKGLDKTIIKSGKRLKQFCAWRSKL